MTLLDALLGLLLELLWPGFSNREDRSIVGESSLDREARRFGRQLLFALLLIAGAVWGVGAWRHWW